MKIQSAVFKQSGVAREHFPTDGLPEIAFVGRSNVGKSSLINALLQRRNLARTSGQPGRTQTANFYLVNSRFFFVDLPGYGYAKVSKADRVRFQRLLAGYLLHRQELRLVVQVIDFRHPPTDLDQQMFAHLSQLQIPRLVVANKLDKVKRSLWEKQRRSVLASLPGLEADDLLLFSAVSRQGVEEVWQQMRLRCGEIVVNCRNWR